MKVLYLSRSRRRIWRPEGIKTQVESGACIRDKKKVDLTNQWR